MCLCYSPNRRHSKWLRYWLYRHLLCAYNRRRIGAYPRASNVGHIKASSRAYITGHVDAFQRDYNIGHIDAYPCASTTGHTDGFPRAYNTKYRLIWNYL